MIKRHWRHIYMQAPTREFAIIVDAAIALMPLWNIVAIKPEFWHRCCVGAVATGIDTIFSHHLALFVLPEKNYTTNDSNSPAHSTNNSTSNNASFGGWLCLFFGPAAFVITRSWGSWLGIWDIWGRRALGVGWDVALQASFINRIEFIPTAYWV